MVIDFVCALYGVVHADLTQMSTPVMRVTVSLAGYGTVYATAIGTAVEGFLSGSSGMKQFVYGVLGHRRRLSVVRFGVCMSDVNTDDEC